MEFDASDFRVIGAKSMAEISRSVGHVLFLNEHAADFDEEVDVLQLYIFFD
jgi:hypothetical protein